MEVSFAKCGLSQKDRRDWFARVLWRAFPAASQRQVAQRAAPVLGLTVRQCENLLNGIHDAKLGTILAALSIAGAECIFDVIGQDDQNG
jgi:hypothetical protein